MSKRRHRSIIATIIALVMIAGGIALLVLAVMTLPTDDHHGQAIDGLDGLAKALALGEGLGAIVLITIGGFVLRAARRAATRPASSAT